MVPVKDVVRAAAAAGFQRYTRDILLRDAPGFDEAWSRASNIPGYFHEVNAASFWAVVHEGRPRTVVEIGSYQGRSTAMIGLALKKHVGAGARLVAIDPHTGDRQALEALGRDVLPSLDLFRLHTSGIGIGDVLEERVTTAVDAASRWSGTVDLLFDDGWHSYEAVKDDANAWLPHLAPDGLACFDDYLHYDEVRRAVDEACAEHGLTLYGTVLAQAWTGRRAEPPAALARAVAAERLKRRLQAVGGPSGSRHRQH
jgi:predicted O-methyltransferase YrrM